MVLRTRPDMRSSRSDSTTKPLTLVTRDAPFAGYELHEIHTVSPYIHWHRKGSYPFDVKQVRQRRRSMP